MIQYIKIENLLPHPKNPRQDVGDISELADSIKENGIMQNLTVVPISENTYHVVIGNRRLAAAKVAGLKELPCIVTDVDEQTQQSIMLLENMQRVDLTPYEQAEGFQMCLDLGMSEDELKEKTGFSKKTIKHRLKLLELDKEKLKESVGRGATLQDYIDLEQIEDIDKKNLLLSKIGTDNFKYELNMEVSRQKTMKKAKVIIDKLKEFMEEVNEQPNGYSYSEYLIPTNYDKYTIPNDITERKYAFEVFNSGSIQIYKERLEIDKNTPKEEKKEPSQEELNVVEIKKKAEVAYLTRLEFVKNTYSSITDFMNNIEVKYLMNLMVSNIDSFGWNEEEIFEEITGIKFEELNDYKLFTSYKKATQLLFALVYSYLENSRDDITVNDYGYYGHELGSYCVSNQSEIKELYEFLEYHGYQPSDEEEEIMFGTHELYTKVELEE